MMTMVIDPTPADELGQYRLDVAGRLRANRARAEELPELRRLARRAADPVRVLQLEQELEDLPAEIAALEAELARVEAAEAEARAAVSRDQLTRELADAQEHVAEWKAAAEATIAQLAGVTRLLLAAAQEQVRIEAALSGRPANLDLLLREPRELLFYALRVTVEWGLTPSQRWAGGRPELVPHRDAQGRAEALVHRAMFAE